MACIAKADQKKTAPVELAPSLMVVEPPLSPPLVPLSPPFEPSLEENETGQPLLSAETAREVEREV